MKKTHVHFRLCARQPLHNLHLLLFPCICLHAVTCMHKNAHVVFGHLGEDCSASEASTSRGGWRSSSRNWAAQMARRKKAAGSS